MNIDKIELEELLKSIKKEKKIEYNDTPSDKQVISLEEKEDASSKENLEIESKFSETEKEEVSLYTDNEFASKVEKEIESEFSEGLKEEVSLDTDNEFASKVEKEIESEFSEGLKEEVKVSSDIETEEKEEISVVPIEAESYKKEENIETEQISKISQKIEKEIDAEYHYQQKENIEVYSNEPDKEKNGEVIEEPESNISKKDVEVEEIDSFVEKKETNLEEIDSFVEKKETNLEEIDSSVEKTNSFIKKGADEYSEETNAVSKSKENTNIKKGADEYSEETNAVSKSKENTSVKKGADEYSEETNAVSKSKENTSVKKGADEYSEETNAVSKSKENTNISKETKAYDPTANFNQQTKVEYSDTKDWKSGRGDFSIQLALSGSIGGFSFFTWKDIEQAASKFTNSFNYHPISPVKNLINIAEDGVDIWKKFDNFSDTNVLSSLNSIVSSAFSLGSGIMGFINQTSKLNSGRYDIMMKDEKHLQEIRSQERLYQSNLKLGEETETEINQGTEVGEFSVFNPKSEKTSKHFYSKNINIETKTNIDKEFKPEDNLDKEKESKQLFSGVTSPKIDESTSNLIPSEPVPFKPEDNFGKEEKLEDIKAFLGKDDENDKEFNPEQNLKPIDESGKLLEEKPSARQTKLGDTEFNIEQALKPRDEDGVFKKEKEKEKDSSVYLGKSFQETKTGNTNYRGVSVSGIEVTVEKDVFRPEDNLNKTAVKPEDTKTFLGKERETREQYVGNNRTIDIETGIETDKNKEFKPEIYIDKESKKAEDEINKIAFKPSAPNTLKTEATTSSNRTRLTEDINSVGYIYVSPVNTDFLNNSRFIKIPLQSNLVSRDDSRKANYTTSSFLSRVGSVKQYTGTESVSYSIETKYFVTSYSNGDGGYTMRNLQRIESLYKSLVYPSYVDKESEVSEDKMNESYYTRPPIINIVIGTSSDKETYPYIDNTEPSTTGVYDISLVVNNFFTNVRTNKDGDTKISFKDFIVTEVVVEKDYEKTPYYLTEKNKNPKDLMGFTVRLTITEIDPNYLGILPTFEDYANFGLRTINTQGTAQNSNQGTAQNSNQNTTQNSNQDTAQSSAQKILEINTPR